ncbi:MAG TPA: Rossmann fold nucleotide-binding protein [Ornithinibacter sp.]|nr:Rossmann fold nucleotide-binding protein [Ornithinibacter sp.]
MREIESLPDLDVVLSDGRPLRGLRLQDLDLGGHEEQLLARGDVEGMVVLGGRMTDDLATHLRAQGALVFPTDPQAPVNPYRASLYQPHELYEGLTTDGYEATPDARAYHWARDGSVQHDAFVTLLRAVHDDSITDALDEFLGDAPVVGVMGGHALERGGPAYADAARLGHALADAGLTVLTGGGPGAMEAANLGAFSPDQSALDHALERLGTVPSFRPAIEPWAAVALALHDELIAQPVPDTRVRSVGIPTWFYGHEPPNVFCNGIAKYFSNAIREDGLLARCTAGLVILEGAAGTVQEVFQSGTRLYYAPEDAVLPVVVLVDRHHWTKAVPVWPALSALAEGRAMAGRIHLVDTVEEAAHLVTAATPDSPVG